MGNGVLSPDRDETDEIGVGVLTSGGSGPPCRGTMTDDGLPLPDHSKEVHSMGDRDPLSPGTVSGLGVGGPSSVQSEDVTERSDL